MYIYNNLEINWNAFDINFISCPCVCVYGNKKLKKNKKVGMIDGKLPSAKSTPSAFRVAAKKACQMSVEEAKAAYPGVQDIHVPYLCMDLTYQYTLLVDGFGQ